MRANFVTLPPVSTAYDIKRNLQIFIGFFFFCLFCEVFEIREVDLSFSVCFFVKHGPQVQPPFLPFLNDQYVINVDSLCGRRRF